MVTAKVARLPCPARELSGTAAPTAYQVPPAFPGLFCNGFAAGAENPCKIHGAGTLGPACPAYAHYL